MERIDTIPSGSFVGYYWMSDAVEPVVIETPDSGAIDHLNACLADPQANPFVIEGQLYDAGSRVSVSIRYVDEHYVISRFDVSESIPDVESKKYDSIALKRYAANRMPGRKLRFLQYWRERPDSLCCGMPVLVPAEKVFVGFEPFNESEK